MLDKQLEEYMGPDAIKAMLDLELDAYFKELKRSCWRLPVRTRPAWPSKRQR